VLYHNNMPAAGAHRANISVARTVHVHTEDGGTCVVLNSPMTHLQCRHWREIGGLDEPIPYVRCRRYRRHLQSGRSCSS
jgi:TATA-binding protein-associated factor Taf7